MEAGKYLLAFGVPCAIVGPSEKLKKRAWSVGWATYISGAHVMHVQGGLAKLAHCGEVSEFQAYQLISVTLNHVVLTLKHAGSLINASMGARGARSKILSTAWRVSCRLGHKRVRYLRDVCVQRAWSCSRYAVQPSRPVVRKVFKISAHSLLNDT